jgi:hypothetical protein
MPRYRLQVLVALVLLVPARAGSARGEDPAFPPDPLDRERFALRLVHGADAPLVLEWSAGAAFLLPVKAGRPIPGSPPRERPSYADLFHEGSHIFLGARFRMRPALSLLLRAGFEYYRGKSVTEGVLGRLRYTSMWIVHVQTGLRLGFPLGLPLSSWWITDFTPREKGALPFIEALAGVAHRPRIDHEPVGPYWRASQVFAAEAAVGIEYRFGSLTVSVAAGFAYRSEPPERVWYADPEAVMAILVRAGLAWRF